jgi:hypothetical protein
MPRRIYIETTIPSYLTARPSRDIIQAARQQLTREWWEVERHNYDLCISQIVLDEAAAGDTEAAQRRVAALANFPLLDLTGEMDGLAEKIMQSGLLPASASRDRGAYRCHRDPPGAFLADVELSAYCQRHHLQRLTTHYS